MMFIRSNFKATILIFSLLALTSSNMFASQKCHDRHHDRGVKAAQANYQDETSLVPTSDQPIPFFVENFRTHFEVNDERTVFEVEVPGLYSIDAFLLLDVPNVGDSVDGYITINGRKLLTFYNREIRTGSPIVDFHFNDRLVYLRRGDQVSVVLSTFAPGTTVLSRGFVIVALNNSH